MKHEFSLQRRVIISAYFAIMKGQSPSEDPQRPDIKRLKALLDVLVERGCQDITFTGGEPLVESDIVLELIRYLRNHDKELPVSIVSNGALISEDFIIEIARLGNVRMNLSIHTDNSEEYEVITGQDRWSIDLFQEKLRLLKQHGILFKLNAVAMRSTTNRESLRRLINLSRKSGAISLKIIELLIVKENQCLLDEHLHLRTVEEWLPDSYRLNRQFARGRIFNGPDPSFQVELRRCRCHFGCDQCLESDQTKSFDGQGNYWSCFAHSEKKEKNYIFDPEFAEKQGKEILLDMFQQYNSGSPSLVHQIPLNAENKKVWFLLDDKDRWKTYLTGKEELLQQFSVINLESEVTSEFDDRKVTHIHCNSSDPEHAKLILSENWEESFDLLTLNYTRFLDDDRVIEGPVDYLLKIAEFFGWKQTGEFTAERTQFTTDDGILFSIIQTRGKTFLSLDFSKDNKAYELAVTLQKKEYFQMIKLPFQQFIRENL